MSQKIEYTPEEDRQLDELIDKFKSDDEYNAHIQREAVTYILRAKKGKPKTHSQGTTDQYYYQ